MKIAVITCYSDPDYIRARGLRAALKSINGVKPLVIKNKHKSWLRYPEVIWQVWKLKRSQNPDAYVLTFRGQEILPFVLAIAGKKPVWFDEFVVPLSYANDEGQPSSFGHGLKSVVAKRSFSSYKRWIQRCTAIFADTTDQAELSARISHMNLSAYVIMPNPPEELPAAAVATIAHQLQPLVDNLS